jgi:Cof subfamily protein (haloacid dehalogenase superfamily)
MVSGEPEILAKLEKIFNDSIGNDLEVFRSEPYFLEIMPKGINKAKAIGILLDHLGYSKEELIACGDGFNDVHMVEYAGLGVAMANACEQVKTVADFVTKSNNDDGVAYVVEKFMLGDVE